MSKIKICGLRRAEDIDYVNRLMPDYIGFILSPGFRRSIDENTASRLKSGLSRDITVVGVFVNDDAERINSLVAAGTIDMVQLHGSESPEFCKKINAPVIKYFNCDKTAQEKIAKYDTDYFLFDSGTGTGAAFDWSLIPKTEKPFFLAGGIGEGNLRRAIKEVCPFAVDISSGAETNGVKDYNKIKRILEIARNE